jgi:hypothetical protein
MFGPKISNVFKSRWNAILWSCSMLLTAYCSVPSENEPGDADQIAALVAQSKPREDKAAAHHANPWARDAASAQRVGTGSGPE